MMRRYRVATTLTLLTCALWGLVACGGGDAAAPPGGLPAPGRAMQEIPDGFDFLPPLHAGKGLTSFNAAAKPVVLIYTGTEAAKGTLIKRFETAEITVETDHFHVNWDTNAATGGLPDGTPQCVIEVWWETTGACDMMGFVDCNIDKPAGKGKKSTDPADYFFDLKDGRVLPIKFAIDQTVPTPVDITATGINPSRGVQEQTLDVAIAGTGFKPSATASFSGTGITVNSTTVSSPTSITANVTIASDAPVGARNLTVTNPWNKVATLADCFTVVEKVRLASIAPTTGRQGESLAVVVAGSGFVSGATASFGTGVTVGSVTFDSATSLTANLTIEAGATVGARDVTVTLPDGQSASLPGAFQVTSAGPKTRLLICSNGAVHEFNALTGAYVGRFCATLPMWGGNISIGPDGDIYVSGNENYGPASVQRYSPSGARKADFVPHNTSLNGNARGFRQMAWAPDGSLIIADCASSSTSASIKQYWPDGTFRRTLVPTGSGGLGDTNAVLLAPGDRLLVTSYAGYYAGTLVKEYNATTGAYVRDLIPLSEPKLGSAVLFRLGPDGQLWLADGMENNQQREMRIKVFNIDTGAFIREFQQFPRGGPYGFDFQNNGTVIAVNYGGSVAGAHVFGYLSGALLTENFVAAGGPLFEARDLILLP